MTKIYNFKNEIEEEELQECANCIIDGGLVVFPTETVYGIGANALDKEAVSIIFKAKGRPTDNPLIVHICDIQMLEQVANISNGIERMLIDKFMPGPLTIILQKKYILADNVSNFDTVGIRMPINKIAMSLIKKANVPIAAPSANISGRPSGTNILDIKDELNGKVDYIIDGGMCDIGIESTVVKVVDNVVNILRPGKITPEDIESIGLKVRFDSHIFEKVINDVKVESPGMKYKHYAPKTKAILLDYENKDNLLKKIIEICEENNNLKIAVIGEDNQECYFKEYKNIYYLKYGDINNLDSISKNIFSLFRKVDELEADLCLVQGMEKSGLGIAIMNRLVRACGYNIIKD